MTLESSASVEQEPYNVETLNTPHGPIRLVYGLHPFDHPASDFGDRIGGFALELSGMDGAPTVSDIEKYVAQARTLLSIAAREGKPLYLTDVGEESALGKLVYTGVVVSAGVTIAEQSYRAVKKKDPTRRDMFGKMLGAAGLAYLSTDALVNAISILGDPKWKATDQVAQVADVVDPIALYYSKLRNLIIADNLELVRERYKEELGDDDLVGMYGMGHKGLGGAVRMGHERRMEELRFILSHVRPPVGLTARGLATVARIQSAGEGSGSWAATDTFLNEDIHRIALEAGVPSHRDPN